MTGKRHALRLGLTTTLAVVSLALAVAAAPQRGRGRGGPPPPMTFFVTSVPVGDGANLGGLAGADAHCQQLAAAAGAGDRTWHAYLSTSDPVVNARDRIGTGPWHNARGAQIARDVAHLHLDTVEDARIGNNLSKSTALMENGERVMGFGDETNQHDILTGTMPDGRAYTDGQDHTCSDWTSNSEDGTAQLGHTDRTGGGNTSWNSVHSSRGCSQANLVSTGGNGYLYCFAVTGN